MTAMLASGTPLPNGYAGRTGFINRFDRVARSLFNDPEPDVQAAAADCLGALKLTEAFEDLQQLYHHF